MIDNIKDLEKYDLARAANYIIGQNKSVGCNPTRFTQIVDRGIAEKNLEYLISELILNAELLEELEKVIKQNPRVVSIEDLIAKKEDGFGLPEDVVRQAKARAEYFDNMRIFISNIK